MYTKTHLSIALHVYIINFGEAYIYSTVLEYLVVLYCFCLWLCGGGSLRSIQFDLCPWEGVQGTKFNDRYIQ